jgi:hypothetical protein
LAVLHWAAKKLNKPADEVLAIWVPLNTHYGLLALVQTGALATGSTVDAKLQQALDTSGTGAKDVAGKAITQLTQAASGSAKQALINLRPEDLDVTNGYAYVRLSVTVGVAASLTAAQVLGVNPRFAPGDANNQTAVVQVV